ncbi:uncharacterized protein LOC129146290 isoform X4 [Talpa occidentalis]|uniref:uncharacterized protein LOC129146290 isoform X4 n=1 Tax=Talpa occidentalis TaxID=50954 RepID=UPI0023F62084|nr:uncharacterized protein LOC129146290 isoform X4 [Talpa occidentalis]
MRSLCRRLWPAPALPLRKLGVPRDSPVWDLSQHRAQVEVHPQFEIGAHVQRNWLEYTKPLEELSEAPSQGAQPGFPAAHGTGQETSQVADWRQADTRGPEGTGEAAPAYAVPEQQESPAGLLGQTDNAQGRDFHDRPWTTC